MPRIVTAGLLVTLLLVLAPSLGAAQMREFKGTIERVNEEELVVDSQQGDKLRFLPAPNVAVQGEKSGWGSLERNDWVIVSWKMLDSPRVAYKVVVIPPQDAE
ncbi:MAG: hypothetical protein QNK04_32360 [Myxococcota bacterium]|nr:hypothetical protein [Myxococcota bacterium]